MTITTMEMRKLDIRKILRTLENHRGIKSFIRELSRQNRIINKKYRVIRAQTYKRKNQSLSILVLSFNHQRGRMVWIQDGQKHQLYTSLIQHKKDKMVLEGYRIDDEKTTHIFSVPYDEKFKNGMKQLKDYEKKMDEKMADKKGLPCIYGNWCGPGCSGPKPPISPVDACCKQHDLCYEKRGYFSKSCDEEFLHCLAPYVAQGDKWAILMSRWFKR